jgi:hypothetical protein
MTRPGLVAANNLSDIVNNEKAWDSLGSNIEYPASPGDFEYESTIYLRQVENADGQELEPSVKIAVNNFIASCKNDGTWNAIKASCILAGARTLNGALVPLVGTPPTNFNFTPGDYNRKTGLAGGGTKSLSSNRNNNADPQANKHVSVYVSDACTVSSGFPRYIGLYRSVFPFDGTQILRNSASSATFGSVDSDDVSRNGQLGFHGVSRASASTFVYRSQGGETIANIPQQSVVAGVHPVFAGRGSSLEAYTNARLAFYSIGESLNLSRLDARVTGLINDLAAAIP